MAPKLCKKAGIQSRPNVANLLPIKTNAYLKKWIYNPLGVALAAVTEQLGYAQKQWWPITMKMLTSRRYISICSLLNIADSWESQPSRTARSIYKKYTDFSSTRSSYAPSPPFHFLFLHSTSIDCWRKLKKW
jgi:hypothetical protein